MSVVFEDGSDSVVDKSAVVGSDVVVVDPVDDGSVVVDISDDDVPVAVMGISVIFC